MKDWEQRDRYPLWIGGEVKSKPGSFDYPEPYTFEDSLIRNLAARAWWLGGLALQRPPRPRPIEVRRAREKKSASDAA